VIEVVQRSSAADKLRARCAALQQSTGSMARQLFGRSSGGNQHRLSSFPSQRKEDRSMHKGISLAAIAAAGAIVFAAPQAASAAPQLSGVKEINKSNVEQTRYRGWRRGYYRRHGYYGHRHYYRRRPGFGIYFGF
jgi:hypothetical protein